ncbi:MAG TPA: TetR family transcriptional regulator [Aeromicrobium sp.]|nr:TetR family transcriptional regulator [Aeromicrobium sp.]
MSSSPAQRERRDRMLQAAMKLASEGGYEAVQMREVADAAGVALGTLYRYFPSKVHLLVAALASQFEQAEAITERRAIVGDTAHDRVMRILGGTTVALQKQPQLTEAMVRAFMFADASVLGEIEQVGSRLTRMIARAIAGTPDHGEATEEEAAIIRVIADVWMSALVSWANGRSGAAEVEKSIDVAVRLLLRD